MTDEHRGPATDPHPRLTRRRLLQLGLVLPGPMLLAACDDRAATDQAGRGTPATTAALPTSAGKTLPATPACDDGDDPTPAQTEGPYFATGSPERTSLLEPGLAGDRLTVTGTVLTTGCQAVRRALLDFWQANAAGEYDNEGYRLRGHQFTDARGRFRLATVVPGLYPGRTRHIHVRVQAPDRPVLTTQLYFPDEPANDRDGIFRPELLLGDLRRSGSDQRASFTFVLDV
jgi:protocatechuate 3,4-dioxygenase beta subunit